MYTYVITFTSFTHQYTHRYITSKRHHISHHRYYTSAHLITLLYTSHHSLITRYHIHHNTHHHNMTLRCMIDTCISAIIIKFPSSGTNAHAPEKKCVIMKNIRTNKHTHSNHSNNIHIHNNHQRKHKFIQTNTQSKNAHNTEYTDTQTHLHTTPIYFQVNNNKISLWRPNPNSYPIYLTVKG